MKDQNALRDEISIERGTGLVQPLRLLGRVVIELFDEHGNLLDYRDVRNLITTAGDQYYAQKGIVGVSPANPSAPTVASGMKLGTGTTAAAKSGAGAALVTYETASNNPFDSTFPSAAAVGGDGGWNAVYKTTWAAGDVTETALTEAVIVNDAAADATSTAANTYARVVFAAVNKGASDSLAITWTHKFLGA